MFGCGGLIGILLAIIKTRLIGGLFAFFNTLFGNLLQSSG